MEIETRYGIMEIGYMRKDKKYEKQYRRQRSMLRMN